MYEHLFYLHSLTKVFVEIKWLKSLLDAETLKKKNFKFNFLFS